MDKLRSTGELKNTIVVYVSDNGNFFGEHRRSDGRSDVYEPSLNVPYAMKMPKAYPERGAGRPQRRGRFEPGHRRDHRRLREPLRGAPEHVRGAWRLPPARRAHARTARRRRRRLAAPPRCPRRDQLGPPRLRRDSNPALRLLGARDRGARALRPAYGPLRAAQPRRAARLCGNPGPAGGAPCPAAPLLRDPGPGRADRAAFLRVAP